MKPCSRNTFLVTGTLLAMFLLHPAGQDASAATQGTNPDTICKYKKKKKCGSGSSSDESTFEENVGKSKKCPQTPPSAKVGDGYEYTLIGEVPPKPTAFSLNSRSKTQIEEKRVIAGGFGPNYVSPKSIHFYGDGAEVVRDANTNIRQLKAADLLTDFVFIAEKTLEIRKYNISDIKPGKVNGVYVPLPGIEPLSIVRMTQSADGDTVTTDIINNEGDVPSVKTEEMTQSFDADTQTLTLIKRYKKGVDLSSVTYRKSTTRITPIFGGAPKEEKFISEIKELGSDDVMYVVERKAGSRAIFSEEEGFVPLYECNAVNEDGTPMTPIATETTYTYYNDPLQIASYGKVKTLRRNDGYWENKYYDANANAGLETEKTESPWLDTVAHDPGTAPVGPIRLKTKISCSTDTGTEDITETVNGILIAKEWTEKTPYDHQKVKEVRHQPHSGGDKITTTVRYRKAMDIPSHLTAKPVSVHNADGSMSLYSYDLQGQDLIVTEDTGYGEGNTVTHGKRTISRQDKDNGNLKEEIRYALEGGQSYWLGSRTGALFDKSGVCMKWIYDNNTEDYTEQRRDCCHVTWERGRDGVETIYNYGAAGYKTETTTRGITYSTEYKGLKTISWRQVTGSNNRFMVEEVTNNLAGNTVEIVAPVVGNKTLTTLFSFNVVAKNTITMTPYGTTKSRIATADGQTLSESGTTGITENYTTTPSDKNGGGLIMFVTDGKRNKITTTDLLGNIVSSQTGSDALTQQMYDVAGRIIKKVLPDGEVQIYFYKNNIKIAGVDLNGDSALNPEHDQMIKNEQSFDHSWPEGKGSWKITTEQAWHGNWKPSSISWMSDDGTLARKQTPGLAGYTLLEKPSIAQVGSSYIDTITYPDGQSQKNSYTINNGQITSAKTTWLDTNEHAIEEENITFDVWGNELTRTNARTGTAIFTYDEGSGVLLNQTTPDQASNSYHYDDFGRLVKTVLPNGGEQHTSYDDEGRVTRQWGSLQYPVSYEYNPYGQMTGMTTYRSPVDNIASWPEGTNGDKTVWIYEDATGNLLKKIYADGKGVVYSYTLGKKRQTQTNARGNVTRYSYDLAGQLIGVDVNDDGLTPSKTYVYDQFGRKTSAITAGVAHYHYIYNDWDQVAEEQITVSTANGNFERNLHRSYDANGRVTGYQLKNGDVVEQDISYAYNPAGQLSRVIADGKEFSYTYFPNASQLVAQMSSPVHTTSNTYEDNRDVLSCKTNCWKNKVDTPVISCYTYTVNSLGQRISASMTGEAFGAAPVDHIWEYDSLGQVVKENEDRYTYDQIGNRLTSQKLNEPDIAYTVNALNQYVQIGNIVPTYDDDGNQVDGLSPTPTLPDRNRLTFSYNAENRPVRASQNDEIKIMYSYDYMGRLVRKGDTVILYDDNNAIAEYKANVLNTSYAWGNDLSGTAQGAGGVGGLLSVTKHNSQLPLVSYPCYDGNGNITEYLLEENSGLLAVHYTYDLFGTIIEKSGNGEYNYQFSTKPNDNITGSICYNLRDYSKSNGSWMTRDESEAYGLNLYGFVENDGVNYIDILGKQKMRPPNYQLRIAAQNLRKQINRHQNGNNKRGQKENPTPKSPVKPTEYPVSPNPDPSPIGRSKLEDIVDAITGGVDCQKLQYSAGARQCDEEIASVECPKCCHIRTACVTGPWGEQYIRSSARGTVSELTCAEARRNGEMIEGNFNKDYYIDL